MCDYCINNTFVEKLNFLLAKVIPSQFLKNAYVHICIYAFIYIYTYIYKERIRESITFFSENIIGAYLHEYINIEIRYKIRIFLHSIQGIKITNDFQEYNFKGFKISMFSCSLRQHIY